jgi:hypothetical protein
MADIDITFTNGSRVFTPTNPPSAPQLGDVNNDGEIDILDAGDVNSFQLTDINNDGVIDLLDAAEILAQGPGGVTTTVPPPTLTPPNPFENPKTCPPGQTLQIIPIGNGLVTTGCNSIPSLPPTEGVGPGPDDNPFFCPEGKVRGFGPDAVTGELTFFNCVCPDASVNIAEIITIIGGAGYGAARKFIIGRLRADIAQALARINELMQNLENIISRQNELDNLIKQWDEFVNGINQQLRNLSPYDPNYIIKKQEYEASLRNLYKLQQEGIDAKAHVDYLHDLSKTKISNLENKIREYENAINLILNAIDPSAIITAFLGSFLPINFIVPKYCGDFSRLDDQCNCVPISSGSYSYSSLTNESFKNKHYTIIENL